ncbi:MAG: amidohydrolase family protein [Hyphomonas sp.]|uniref:metal-dependent hydrolase family protein n=1 Tax=Hyphomonas sp. TaxID=87 RepID=UPI0017AB0C40|nr:amidohydrolase family protein [Hyphomonas sp.]MBA3067316.1 amidohydrolase family protein [Hyphomonas sp.]MBU3921539.1 amidohydrolase family protein [Alphaproteobacteria bacterium]MBU4063005.1 amidohydrolase family protein [Alphaproteobacteria bacterium]MBU4163586.1 amidohydrolase family protein [Alphaproteobacteria bacterium]
MNSSSRILRSVAVAAAALVLALPALAETLYVQAGKVLAVPGEAPLGETTIIVTDGRIVSLTPGFQAPKDKKIRVIDLKDKYVLPGLIDSHVHLTSDAGGLAGQLEDVTLSPAAQAFNAWDNGMKTLRAGFTTVRNLGDGDGAVLALRDAVNDGQVTGPRILDAGASISASAGHMDGSLGFRDELREYFNTAGNTCSGADDCRRAVRLQVARGADVIKLATTGGVNSRIGAGLGKQMFEDEARAIVETAKLFGKKVSAHAHGADGIRLALLAGVDSIEHGTILDPETIDAFVASDAYYVPTLSTVNGYIERLEANPDAYEPDVKAKIEWRIGITGKSLETLYAAGVKIAFGTDAGVSKHGRNADEFELLVKFGMPPAEAIKAATVNAADLLGLSAEIGTLEPGKSADLIAVKGDPLKDVKVLKAVEFVMVRGGVAKE